MVHKKLLKILQKQHNPRIPSSTKLLIIGNKISHLKTRSTFRQEYSMLGLISLIEPTSVDEELTDDGWIMEMQVELNMFQRNDF